MHCRSAIQDGNFDLFKAFYYIENNCGTGQYWHIYEGASNDIKPLDKIIMDFYTAHKNIKIQDHIGDVLSIFRIFSINSLPSVKLI